MAEFLIETYASRETANAVAMQVREIARAAKLMGEHGTDVRFLLAIFVPEEETCFYLYQSPSADAVREAATRARLPFEGVTGAISIAPHQVPARNPHRTDSTPNQQTITRSEET
jgi:hypothetical protein